MRRFTGWVCAALIVALGISAQAAEKSLKKENFTFGTLSAPSDVTARVQAATWLKEVGQYDASRQAFDALWADKDKTLLDRVADTLSLGDPAAAKLLQEARDLRTPAPTALPAVLQDSTKSNFYRANQFLSGVDFVF